MEFNSIDEFIKSINSESDINIDIVDIDYEQAHYGYKTCLEVLEDSYFTYYSEESLIIKPHTMGYYPVRFMETMGIKYMKHTAERVKNNKNKSKNKKRKHRY